MPNKTYTTEDFIARAREAHSNITEIPYWEHVYVYPYTSKLITPNGVEDVVKIYPEFPNMEVENFYNLFKNEFFNGNYIDLNGFTNYAFYLLFDIVRLGYDMCEKYLPILSQEYPETSSYCETEMGKLEICTREYDGDQYYKYSGKGNGVGQYCFVVKDNFQYKQQILQWLIDDEYTGSGGIGTVAFVNKSGIINIISDNTQPIYGITEKSFKRKYFVSVGVNNTCCPERSVVYRTYEDRIKKSKLPDFIKFGYVEGDFIVRKSPTIHYGLDDSQVKESDRIISLFSIDSLEGFPKTINGNFICEKIGLNSLNGGPQYVYGDYNVRHNSLTTLEGMPKYVEGTFNIYDNDIDDNAYEWADKNYPDHSVGNINIGKNKLVKYRK